MTVRLFRAGTALVDFVRGDITAEDTDAIVNAANPSLLGGGGVDGAIHRAAGPDLVEACREVKKTLPAGRLEVGQAVMTAGFRLKARWVIHCAGPIYSDAGKKAPELLASCYRNALKLCAEHKVQSVAFPSISTGVYGYPVEAAAQVAVREVKAVLGTSGGPNLVRFVLHDLHSLQVYVAAAEALLPRS